MNQSKLKVLTIGHSYVVSSNRSIVNEINLDPEFDIKIVCPNGFNGSLRYVPLEDPGNQNNFNLIPIDTAFDSRIHIFYYRNLEQVFKENDFDLVHVWEEPYIFAGWQIARLCSKYRVPFFFRTAQSYNKTYLPPFSFFEKYVVKKAIGWNAGATLVYENLLNRGYPRDNSTIITLGTSKERFFFDEMRREVVRKKLSLKGPVLIFLGRFVPAKGIDHILKSLELLEQESIYFEMLFLGSGELESVIRNWISREKLEDRVKVILASHDQVPDYLIASDILLAPSQSTSRWREQFGRMIIEAFATKTAVIGSDSGEIPFVIGDAGFVFPEKSVEDFYQGIKSLILDTELREEFIEKGFKKFHKHFESAKIAEKYKEYYRSLLLK